MQCDAMSGWRLITDEFWMVCARLVGWVPVFFFGLAGGPGLAGGRERPNKKGRETGGLGRGVQNAGCRSDDFCEVGGSVL